MFLRSAEHASLLLRPRKLNTVKFQYQRSGLTLQIFTIKSDLGPRDNPPGVLVPDSAYLPMTCPYFSHYRGQMEVFHMQWQPVKPSRRWWREFGSGFGAFRNEISQRKSLPIDKNSTALSTLVGIRLLTKNGQDIS